MLDLIKKRAWFIVIGLLILMFTLEISSAVKQSQIIDESPHIVAGYSYLKTGDFRLNPEHPPLIKMLSGLPLQFMKLRPLSENASWLTGEQWSAGRIFLYENTVDHFWLLFWARLPIMLLSILLGLIIFKWTKSLFGVLGGLIALLFYVFDPTTLAHSRWITTDLGIALFIFATLYFLYRFFQKPTLGRTFVFAFVFALALLAKFSAVILIPLTLLYLIIAKWQGWPCTVLVQGGSKNQITQQIPKPVGAGKFILITIIVSIITVWGVYGFELKKPYSDPEIPAAFAPGKSQQHFDKAWLTFVNKFTDTDTAEGRLTEKLAKTIPIPAYTYIKGFATLANHNYWGHTAFLMGKYSAVGWWYYFIVAFLVKTPLVTILFLLVTIGLIGIRAWSRLKKGWIQPNQLVATNGLNRIGGFFKKLFNFFRGIPVYWYMVILTPTLYFIWTLTSKLNLGVRHLLPIYPFIFLLFGAFTTIRLGRRAKLWRGLFIVLIIFYIASSIMIYPNYLSYFNEAVGGPSQGHKYLLDSNIDWGQDLIGLKKYVDEHQLGKIYFHYFGTADPTAYGIIHESPPTNEQIRQLPNFKGVVAISVSGLYSETREFSWLLKHEPIDRIGYSIWIYDIECPCSN
ncbi:MAG: glycosyltransferase family 39 protein [Patescibacteria group bacterium]|nr:glycosyltransferase family 39 protein [Patescibacteria group bacterium]